MSNKRHKVFMNHSCHKKNATSEIETANMFVCKAISVLTLTYNFVFLSSIHKQMLFASTQFSLNIQNHL